MPKGKFDLDRGRLSFYPAYSPGLNPDELLNREVKSTGRTASSHPEARVPKSTASQRGEAPARGGVVVMPGMSREGHCPGASFGETTGSVHLVGRSPVMRELYAQIEILGRSDVPVLVEGETGVGKNLVARAIHQAGQRSRAPFLAFSAANMSETLFESELFGHVKGAFSGAYQDHLGLARAADGGSLFLDEVGDLSLANQAKLLFFLDRMEVRPVGGLHFRSVDVRVLCATNRDVPSLVRRGTFRQDLYFRLTVMALRVPSLRERREDIPVLAMYFLERFSRRDGKEIAGLSEQALALLLDYDWRGNVRELENTIRRAVVMTPSGQRIEADTLRPGIRTILAADGPERAAALRECRENAEKEAILGTLARDAWNVSAAARELGITRVGLTRKIKRLGIERPGRSSRI